MPEPIAILLVDDEPLILMDLEFAAEDAGLAPRCASSVAQALAQIEIGVDVAVLDFNLTGGETCIPIAQQLDARGIPYVIHSGDAARRDDVFETLDAVYVAKPTASEAVIATALAEMRSADRSSPGSVVAA